MYVPPAADFPVVTNTVISSTHFNNTINDLATGLTTTLTKDGQSTPTANIKLGGFKLTGLGAPTVSGDALSEGAAIGATTPSTLRGTSLTLTTAASKIVSGATSLSLRNNADSADNLLISDAGVVTVRTSVVTPIVDSGSTGALAFKTNNGITGFQITHVASGVNFLGTSAQAAGAAAVFLFAQGADTNLGITLGTKGTQSHNFVTDVSGSALTQFQVLHTASATRNITVTGSNGGNPTISTTAGALALGNGQLQWPATQNPSADVNTLDDYEEGTWTPSLGGSTTYTNQTGSYTKIGRLVFIRCALNINAIGTGSTTTVSGLPFVPALATNISCSAGACATSIVSLSAGTTTSSTIVLTSRTAASASEAINAIFQNATTFFATGCYEV